MGSQSVLVGRVSAGSNSGHARPFKLLGTPSLPSPPTPPIVIVWWGGVNTNMILAKEAIGSLLCVAL